MLRTTQRFALSFLVPTVVFAYIETCAQNVKQPQFGLSRLRKSEVKLERRLLGLMAVGNQATDDIDHEVDGAAMPRMLYLRGRLKSQSVSQVIPMRSASAVKNSVD
jgi:hypothetical protein